MPAEQLIQGDGRNNIIVVSLNKDDPGLIDITIDGKTQSYPATAQISIDAKGGHDLITVESDVTVGIEIDGGSGNDRIIGGAGNDTISGGRGRDRINAGAGNDIVTGGKGIDYIDGQAGDDSLEGGRGNDVIYGGTGQDQISGDRGDDYIEGGEGNDVADGGRGQDVVSGGLGMDELSGGKDVDVIYAGEGQDTINDSDANKVFAQADDSIIGSENQVTTVDLTGKPGSQSIQINGSQEFVDRVNADLELLRSSPSGRQMLEALDQTGKTVNIDEYGEDNGGAGALDSSGNLLANPVSPPNLPAPTLTTDPNGNVVPGQGYDVQIFYNPAFNHSTVQQTDSAPIIILYHELSHAYNIATGTLQPGFHKDTDSRDFLIPDLERQAVGLPNGGLAYDFDNDPTTAPSPINPFPLTENGLRDEFNRSPRESYDLPFDKQYTRESIEVQDSYEEIVESYINTLERAVRTENSGVLSQFDEKSPIDAAREHARQVIKGQYPYLSDGFIEDLEIFVFENEIIQDHFDDLNQDITEISQPAPVMELGN